MDFMFEIYQRESLQFLIQSEPPVNYQDKLLNIIVKKINDTNNNNTEAIINRTTLLNSINLSQEDYDNALIGIIKVNIDSTETNIKATDYKVMIQITDDNDNYSLVLCHGTLKVKDNYLKKV